MSKLKKIVLITARCIKFLFSTLTSNKIKISKNKKTRIKGNETENVSIIIQRNEESDISENKFIKK